MVDSVFALILANRRVPIVDISEHREFSVDTVHEIVHAGLSLSKVSCRLVSPEQCKISENC